MTSDPRGRLFPVGLRPEYFGPRDMPEVLGTALAEAKLPIKAWYCGNPGLLSGPDRVSLAGSRQAEQWALDALEWTAHHLAESSAVVISGGALGTDCAAHAGALKAGGVTVVIPPIPLNDLDPNTWRPELRALWHRERTLFLSIVAPWEHPSRTQPILRNRLMVALGHACVAGQTGVQGGTNHFLATARELHRPTYVLRQPHAGAELRLALKSLERAGAVPFSAAEAAEGGFAARVVAAGREFRRLAAEDAARQTSLFPEGHESG